MIRCLFRPFIYVAKRSLGLVIDVFSLNKYNKLKTILSFVWQVKYVMLFDVARLGNGLIVRWVMVGLFAHKTDETPPGKLCITNVALELWSQTSVGPKHIG